MGASESKLAFRKTVFALHEQAAGRLDDAYWAQFWQLPESVDDVFNLFTPADVRAARDQGRANFVTLCHQLVNRICAFLQKAEAPTADDKREVLNCVRVLTRLFPYIFETKDSRLENAIFWSLAGGEGAAEGAERAGPAPAVNILPQHAGSRLIQAIVALLFYRGFTLPLAKGGLHGIHFVIWYQGVGSSSQPGSSAEYDSNRLELLRLLLTILSVSIYTPPQLINTMRTPWFELITAHSLEKKQVLSILCSLLNGAINYDPVGWNLIPYNHVLFADTNEQLALTSAHLLIALLDTYDGPGQPPRNATSLQAGIEDTPRSVATTRTNEAGSVAGGSPALAVSGASTRPGEEDNDFTYYLSKLHRPADFDYILLGMTRLLRNSLDAANTYLPGSTKRAIIYPEILMLFWKFIMINPGFLDHFLTSPQLEEIVIAICFFLLESRETPNQIGLMRLCCFILQRLSQEREFGVQLNRDVSRINLGPVHQYIYTIANGTLGDYVMACLIYVMKGPGTGSASGAAISPQQRSQIMSMYDNFLVAMVNISPYLKSLDKMTVTRLLNVFLAFSHPAFLLRVEAHHRWLFLVLECINNLLQYQIAGNAHLVYNVLRNKERFEALEALDFATAQEDLQRIEAARQSGQSSQASASASASESEEPRSPAAAPGSVGSQNNSPPRSATSPASASSAPTASAFVATEAWFNRWKVHLPITIVTTLVRNMMPDIERFCQRHPEADDEAIVASIRKSTTVGLLPLPTQIYIRKFHYTEHLRVWFLSYFWGNIFSKNTGAIESSKLQQPIWTGTAIRLFHVKLNG
ncbi:hypothetical protein CXG81DRAFT_19168 [Caulochytrium protostelioides]|uniref:Uncharacterized protein n=1 Tax=Caulochytrium protostelioides TaxID=1555241 RepID=A0A4P9X703_9FUNG|nr:hypothetical protein CXG81DRAFT_19168 [Caulochytrium protostelioides]|eukprot:RKP00978.1 hypothetical protein CXG81DRAFT_19168 [Caulochytrium protostelioides]